MSRKESKSVSVFLFVCFFFHQNLDVFLCSYFVFVPNISIWIYRVTKSKISHPIRALLHLYPVGLTKAWDCFIFGLQILLYSLIDIMVFIWVYWADDFLFSSLPESLFFSSTSVFLLVLSSLLLKFFLSSLIFLYNLFPLFTSVHWVVWVRISALSFFLHL